MLAIKEIEEDFPVDLSQLRSIPLKKTLLLLNNFTANTTRFLNHFATVCESKLVDVSHTLTRLETSLALLETKLNSIHDLEESVKKSSNDDDVDVPTDLPQFHEGTYCIVALSCYQQQFCRTGSSAAATTTSAA